MRREEKKLSQHEERLAVVLVTVTLSLAGKQILRRIAAVTEVACDREEIALIGCQEATRCPDLIDPWHERGTRVVKGMTRKSS